MSALVTRQPTGLAPWPLLLIAGAEKAGKSWACAAASGADLVGRTLWVGMGEDDPDEYALVDGARFEIVEHDGTYRGFLDALTAAVAEPRTGDKPTLIVVDSMTRVWNLLSDMAQDEANARARRKGKVTDEADISMDLWNLAKQRWGHIMSTLREHRGPVLVTARLDEVTVMQGGRPTTDKALKVQAEKSLVYDVGGIVEMPERGKAYLKGIRSTRLQLPERALIPNFTVDELWRRLGLYDNLVDDARQHPTPQRVPTDPTGAARTATPDAAGPSPEAEPAPVDTDSGAAVAEGKPAAAPDTTATKGNGWATVKTLRVLNDRLVKAGFGPEPEKIRTAIGQIIGREVTSGAELTSAEADIVRDALDAAWTPADVAAAASTGAAMREAYGITDGGAS